MADEPSIDEILASLDSLLKESDSGNDDIASHAHDVEAEADESVEALEASLSAVFEKPRFRTDAEQIELMASPEAVTSESDGEAEAGSEAGADEPDAEASVEQAVDAAEAVDDSAEEKVSEAASDTDAVEETEAVGSMPDEPAAAESVPSEEVEEEPEELAEPAGSEADDGPEPEALSEPEAEVVDEPEAPEVDVEMSLPSEGDEAEMADPAGDTPAIAQPEPVQAAPASRPPVKLVLTEAMLVEDHQSELPFADRVGEGVGESMVDEAPEPVDEAREEAAAEQVLPEAAPVERTDSVITEAEQDSEPSDAWVEMIGRRVVERLEVVLPELIREAIRETADAGRHQTGNDEKDSDNEPE